MSRRIVHRYSESALLSPREHDKSPGSTPNPECVVVVYQQGPQPVRKTVHSGHHSLLYRTLHNAIRLTSSLELVPGGARQNEKLT
jgi:hypothetical protein